MKKAATDKCVKYLKQLLSTLFRFIMKMLSISICSHSHERLLSIGLNLLSHSSLIICIVAFLCSLILLAGNEKYFNAWKEIKSFIFFDAKCQISFCLCFYLPLGLFGIGWETKTKTKRTGITLFHEQMNVKVWIYS